MNVVLRPTGGDDSDRSKYAPRGVTGMSDHADDPDHQADHDVEGSDHPEPRPDHRQTAPQGPYTNRMVGIGAVVALVGLLVVFGVPVLLTL